LIDICFVSRLLVKSIFGDDARMGTMVALSARPDGSSKRWGQSNEFF
jgi:hypothetical protein